MDNRVKEIFEDWLSDLHEFDIKLLSDSLEGINSLQAIKDLVNYVISKRGLS